MPNNIIARRKQQKAKLEEYREYRRSLRELDGKAEKPEAAPVEEEVVVEETVEETPTVSKSSSRKSKKSSK